eukprot:25973-Pelagococcus_subviridis.AAC.1
MTREDAKRKPLAEVSEDEFLEDLVRRAPNGGEKLAPPGCGTSPARILLDDEISLECFLPAPARDRARRARVVRARGHVATAAPTTYKFLSNENEARPLTIDPILLSRRPIADANTFPTRTLNGAKLDLFGLYRAVVSRGGFPSSKGGVNGGGGGDKREKLNWTRDVFPCLSNYTENHRATSVGHDLITHYQNYLCEYELANPEDVVTSAADPTSLSFRTDPRPPAVSVSAEGG